jgi:hypothetical protein
VCIDGIVYNDIYRCVVQGEVSITKAFPKRPCGID